MDGTAFKVSGFLLACTLFAVMRLGGKDMLNLFKESSYTQRKVTEALCSDIKRNHDEQQLAANARLWWMSVAFHLPKAIVQTCTSQRYFSCQAGEHCTQACDNLHYAWIRYNDSFVVFNFNHLCVYLLGLYPVLATLGRVNAWMWLCSLCVSAFPSRDFGWTWQTAMVVPTLIYSSKPSDSSPLCV